MKKYNVAVIGYGWASTAHIQAINATSQAQVVAVYSSRPQDPAALSARHGGSIATYTDLDALLAKKKDAHAAPPTFLPLEPFVVNLADREQERYAQIGITLQVDDPQVAEQLKAYMPAIRNGVLMILAHKTSSELLDREGKLKLADEIMRESVRPLGIELDDEDADEAEAHDAKPARKKKRKAPVHNPVEHVHFSSFIIQ